MSESPRAIRYRNSISASARTARSQSPSLSPPLSPSPASSFSNDTHNPDEPPSPVIILDPLRKFSYFHHKIDIPWPLDWLTDTSAFILNGRSAIPRTGSALAFVSFFLYGVSLRRLVRRDMAFPQRVQLSTSPDEVRFRTPDDSPLSSRASSASEPVRPFVDDDMDPNSINNNSRRELARSPTPESPTTVRAWRQQHQYLVSRAHLRVSLTKLRILKFLLLLFQIIYRVLLTLLRYYLFFKHILPVLDSNSLGLPIRLVFRTVFMFLLFGSMSYYEVFMGMVIQATVWNVWGEQKWEVRDYLLDWPWWVLVSLDLFFWWLPRVNVGGVWEVMGLGICVLWTLAAWTNSSAITAGWT